MLDDLLNLKLRHPCESHDFIKRLNRPQKIIGVRPYSVILSVAQTRFIDHCSPTTSSVIEIYLSLLILRYLMENLDTDIIMSELLLFS